MLSAPDCSFFQILGFPIYYYGVILAVAIFIGIVLANKIALEKYCLPMIVPNIATSVVLGGIIGARLYYCLLNYKLYIASPLEILAIREGGLSIHGAIIGGLFVLLFQAKRYNVEFLKLCDIFALGVPVAQAIGRWGNFFNSEAFGLPTNLPWKMFVKQQYRPDEYFSYEYFHPTFLYESILDIVMFFILYFAILPKNKENSGIISASYLSIYSVIRFFIEYLRVDCVKYMWGVPVPQIVSIIIIILSVSFILYQRNKEI